MVIGYLGGDLFTISLTSNMDPVRFLGTTSCVRMLKSTSEFRFSVSDRVGLWMKELESLAPTTATNVDCDERPKIFPLYVATIISANPWNPKHPDCTTEMLSLKFYKGMWSYLRVIWVIIADRILTLEYSCWASISSKSVSDFMVNTWTVPSRLPRISSGFPSPIKSNVSRQVTPEDPDSVSTNTSCSTAGN